MATQTRTWQKKILTEAKKFEYSGLYWVIEAKVPGNIHSYAAFPGRYVPVIEVAPDPAITENWAQILLELFKSVAQPTIELSIALTSEESLATISHWYEYGDELLFDFVCAVCGAVEQVNFQTESIRYLCAQCSDVFL